MALLGFFNKHHIDPKIHHNLSCQDKELGTEIRVGMPYYIPKDNNNQLLQALVPMGKSVQPRLLTRAVVKDDQLSLIYARKHRFNQLFSHPNIKAAMLQTHRRNHYVFAYKDKYYDELGQKFTEFLLKTPVKRAQVIGKVGSTGLSTELHLHFGMYRNDCPIDPLGRIRTAKSQLKGHEKQFFSQAIRPYPSMLEDLTSFEHAHKENTKNTDQ
ncbi:peptidoglycan DD-metalloendopeptidase family protein [Helicobacter sp. NHP22-001]|uniref:peptidoglycan DD-metalloendopeptidase family protein n=1 Tax=Helicobacter sp. NHP22-001 TaxID=3040202 RepID=UPI00244D7EC9|nr:peptidoglycan DD-metalloendopeptidase family protein [Helicobacter sp. NHP22-001]GMB95628.1 hypothetical protein NHP22001_02170 [Helicobacter sp. NHP22-001]